MSLAFQVPEAFDAAAEAALGGEALIVDLDGYEGPLDVLLALARTQKVDMLQLSVTKLVDQYLAFLRGARERRFAVAADYLVMAAWLAWLKSRLLLVRPATNGDDEAPAEAMAAQLAFRLAKLDAMRRAAESLAAGPILGRDVFPRGDPVAVTIVSSRPLQGDLNALMHAYVEQRRRAPGSRYRPDPPTAYRLDDARERLRQMLPRLERWTSLGRVAPEGREDGPSRASMVASTLSASLELVREGALEARQLTDFAEVYLRARRVVA